MAMCSTVIAPLEMSAFNACKSRVKFLEAALSGCRLVATPIPDMQVIGSTHLTLANNCDDWYEALSELPNTNQRRELAIRNMNFLQENMKIDGLKKFGEL
ncbi:hypothetical protein A0U87_04070 [Sphingobium sp. MP9-4]|nr:hypothetical protein A0U87_04070 [Sphingobium sp. MP9-4]